LPIGQKRVASALLAVSGFLQIRPFNCQISSESARLIPKLTSAGEEALSSQVKESFPFFESNARCTSERRTHMGIFDHKQEQQGTNIVLVHGAWVDGSSWSDVIERLQKAGYSATAVQLALTGLSDDVARVRQVLSALQSS